MCRLVAEEDNLLVEGDYGERGLHRRKSLGVAHHRLWVEGDRGIRCRKGRPRLRQCLTLGNKHVELANILTARELRLMSQRRPLKFGHQRHLHRIIPVDVQVGPSRAPPAPAIGAK